MSIAASRNASEATRSRTNPRFVVTPKIAVSSSAATSAPPRRLARGAVGDDLAEHRVVGRADLLAGLERGVDAGAGRPAHERRAPGLGEEAVGRVLGVDAGLDRVTGGAHVVLRERQRLALGDAQLQGDEVEAADELGDRVLDLQAGVHLEQEGRPRRRP